MKSLDTNKLTYQIALTLIQGIGNVTAKTLLSYCGSIQNIFEAAPKQLLKIPSIGQKTVQLLAKKEEALLRATKEVEFIQKNDITPLFFTDTTYPLRLRNCTDSPILLYQKGTVNLNPSHVISIVGTRKGTDYGRKICENLIESFAAYDVLIVSGLAYGIDYQSHKACVQQAVPTEGVLAHGLDRIYPFQHTRLAQQMTQNGGLLSEFVSEIEMHPRHFPMRNRLIAGMADATLVIETAKKGGSIITANIARNYNRDVFAFPGSIHAPYSVGCNDLIKKNIATLVQSPEEIIEALGWGKAGEKPKSVQKTLLLNLSKEEEIVITLFKKMPNQSLSKLEIKQQTKLSSNQLFEILLNLELNGLLKKMPGNKFKLE